MNVIGIMGWKNSGKTTLVARLIPALQALGLTVSTIKHVHHELDLDQPGKDTYVHRQAGAVDVVMYSDKRWALLHERGDESRAPPQLEELMGHMTPVDLVLAEGFKDIPMRKLEIRGDGGGQRLTDAGIGGIIGVVSDGPADAELPTFRRGEIDELAGFIESTIRTGMIAVACG